MTRHIAPALALVIVVILTAGCGTGRPVTIAPTNGSTPTTAAAPSPTTAASSGLLAMTLTDVRSGESFSLAQLEGKVTIVQHMAVW